MTSEVMGALIWTCSVLIASFSQVMLKMAANKKHDSLLKEYLNPITIGAYVILAVSMIMTRYGMKFVDYSSWSPVLESLSYISAPLFGVWLLKEKITKRRMLGFAVMIVGILIFATK